MRLQYCNTAILQGFYQQQSAYRLASYLGVDAKTVSRVYQQPRIILFHVTELEGTKMFGEIELDESYFRAVEKVKGGAERPEKALFSVFLKGNAGLTRKLWSLCLRRL